MKTVCVIDGHPDPDPDRLIHALCNAYQDGAVKAGHHLTTIRIADLAVCPLETKASFTDPPDPLIQSERDKIRQADHVMLAFPLWLGSMPSKTRAFFEQAARDSFFLATDQGNRWPRRFMKGKSARIVVTMGMPALAYRTLMGSASLRAVERGILGISGFKPIRHTIIGGVEDVEPNKCEQWFEDMRVLGGNAE